jgi:homoserine kinase
MKIKVPATSANLGPGFDSLGIALNRYLIIDVGAPCEKWHIAHNLGEEVASDASNLLITTALSVAPALSARHLTMTSNIPLARGLGSSSSVIVAGIELANQLGELHLTMAQKLDIATQIEGHPDNVAPALMGDFTVSSFDGKHVTSLVVPFPRDAAFVAFIPDEELSTKVSRAVLPREQPFAEAVKASAVANTLVAAVAAGRMEEAGHMMQGDRFHEPYRTSLVPQLATVRSIGARTGAYATYLSGAGPTVMTILPRFAADEFATALTTSGLAGEVAWLEVDRTGIKVFG